MNIEDKRKLRKVLKFEDLDYDDVFTPYDKDEMYFMKIHDTRRFDGGVVNAINLFTSDLATVSSDAPVKVLKAKLVIED